MSAEQTEIKLASVLEPYQSSFSSKIFETACGCEDLLMKSFCITPEMKMENMQYWGRELGACWEKMIQTTLRDNCKDYQGPLSVGSDEICDCRVRKYAIDAKYRVGSGDSGTLKKFKQYGEYLKKNGYIPIMVFLREDNLESAITAIKTGGWEYTVGEQSFEFIKNISNFDLKRWLESKAGAFRLKPKPTKQKTL